MSIFQKILAQLRDPKMDYIGKLKNVDLNIENSITKLKKRYPNRVFKNKLKIKNLNIFNLPFKDNSVDEIRAEAFIEHLSFVEEKKFFYEVKRVLKSKGKINFSHGKIYTLPKNIKLVACYHPSPRNVNTGRINEKKMKNLFKKVLRLN